VHTINETQVLYSFIFRNRTSETGSTCPHGLPRGSRAETSRPIIQYKAICEAGSHFTFQLIEKSRQAWLCGRGALDSAASASAISRRIISAMGRTSLRRSDLPSRLSRRAGPPALSHRLSPQAIRDCDAPPSAWRSVHPRKGERSERRLVPDPAMPDSGRSPAGRSRSPYCPTSDCDVEVRERWAAGPGDPPFVVVSRLSSASPMHPLCCRKCEADRDRPDKSPLRDFVNASLR
jgi:hypothetical protein